MNNEQLLVTPNPHIKDSTSVEEIMWTVVYALIPAVLAATYFFGFRALLVVAVSVIGAVLTEYTFLKIRNKEIVINDGSAVLTGLLLALTLPPSIPLWTAFLGSVVGIGLGKQVFGGLGYNVFNPALIGRAFLTASYPVLMTTWTVDGTSTATPLSQISGGKLVRVWNLFIGNTGGSLGETSALALLLGAAYLIYKGYINWRIPTGMISTVIIVTFLAGANPVVHLFAGSLILGAFYMATDMVTSPVTKKARWVFGIGAGLLVAIIRLWGGYPEGVMYSILFMNTTVPLLDRYLKPKTLGVVK
ncbi:MAG TPA: RnfABCDGE type electron transport complex subunit D [Halanaerobiales bacterium]|nr:RnfABCDGE type electron transport complex subunit D [Halanaerobiales bacterium]